VEKQLSGGMMEGKSNLTDKLILEDPHLETQKNLPDLDNSQVCSQ